METSIFSIPNTILMEILSKLPITTICNCKCVCYYFRNLISDPQFAQLHLSTSQPSLMLHSYDSRESSLYLVESIYTCDVESDIDDNIYTSSNTLLKFYPECDGPAEGLEVLSSCNGLICFYWPNTFNPYVICNPVINEYVIVPQTEKGYSCSAGFGFCPGTNQYKVLRILYPIISFYVQGLGQINLEAEINTLGTNLWRRVGDAPRYLQSYSGGCFLNGALHWIVAENYSELMCCFDFGKENFQPFPGPSQFRGLPGWMKEDAMILGELKGSLSLCHRPSDDDTHDIWVMKDYAVQESWTKDFVIKIPLVEAIYHNYDCRNYHYQPLMGLNNEDILMLGDLSLLLSWNIRDRSFRRVNGLPFFFRVIPYIQSFVSIKNVASGRYSQGVDMNERSISQQLGWDSERNRINVEEMAKAGYFIFGCRPSYGDDPDFDCDNMDESRIDYGAKEFWLFAVDLNNGEGWTEKKSLGDNALFLGDNASISVQISEFPEIKANCIYCTDDCWEAYKSFKRGGGRDMGIYNLEDGSRMPYYRRESFSSICPPIWVNPSF
ncbi:hypothetical protein RHSIM_Rhsim04G0040700 [Rhododendron simsii]|uniref:F-box domain-containing protein n=1 Tax=Rhododendron simsii TaxID=118357 RepID=A0A834H2T8_RHOSS|nr:hypothetical protein RHSIM_Rhsim04G0040700 [Rhododendron simsii]